MNKYDIKIDKKYSKLDKIIAMVNKIMDHN